jgi:hypothetical protein
VAQRGKGRTGTRGDAMDDSTVESIRNQEGTVPDGGDDFQVTKA